MILVTSPTIASTSCGSVPPLVSHEYDPAGAGIVSGLRAGERVFRIVLVAVEEMLAIEQHFAARGLRGLDRLFDGGEIFLGLHFQRDAHLKGGALANQANGVGFGGERRRQARDRSTPSGRRAWSCRRR